MFQSFYLFYSSLIPSLFHCNTPPHTRIVIATYLCEDAAASQSSRGVESLANVQSGDGVDFFLGEVERDAVEVLLQSVDTVGLGDNNDVSLGAPSQEHLARRHVVLLGGGLDGVNLKERLELLGPGVVQLDERGRPEGGVSGNGDVVLLCHGNELRLGQVGVVLDLENSRGNLGVGQ